MPPAAAAASPPPSTEESTVPPAVGWSPEALAVWHALCEGAGVRLDPPPNTGPAFMRVVGMMLRSSVDGTVQLMAMRQATRQELQAQVTVIRREEQQPAQVRRPTASRRWNRCCSRRCAASCPAPPR